MTRRIPIEDGVRLELALPNGRVFAHAPLPGPQAGETVRLTLAGGIAYSPEPRRYAALRDAGVEAVARVEADSISALLSFARTGWACVMAQTWVALQGPPPGMRSLALTDPEIAHTVGLVEPETDLVHPIVRALHDELSTHDIDAELARRGRAAPGHD